MAILKEFNIKNTKIKFDDEFVRDDYREIILTHIATAAKVSLSGKHEEISKTSKTYDIPDKSPQSDLN